MGVAGREYDRVWAALGDPTRRGLLDALLIRGEATATTLSSGLPVTRQAVAKHLAVLGRAGLISSRRDGRAVFYAVRTDSLDDLGRVMSHIVGRWTQRLAAIKDLAEAEHAGKQPRGGSDAHLTKSDARSQERNA